MGSRTPVALTRTNETKIPRNGDPVVSKIVPRNPILLWAIQESNL